MEGPQDLSFVPVEPGGCCSGEQEKIKGLYLKIRDSWRYNPYDIGLTEEHYKASIIANKEENTREDIELLQSEFNVYVSDIETISDAYKMIEQVNFFLSYDTLR